MIEVLVRTRDKQWRQPEKCFMSEGDEFWRCIASFIKEKTEKPSTEA